MAGNKIVWATVKSKIFWLPFFQLPLEVRTASGARSRWTVLSLPRGTMLCVPGVAGNATCVDLYNHGCRVSFAFEWRRDSMSASRHRSGELQWGRCWLRRGAFHGLTRAHSGKSPIWCSNCYEPKRRSSARKKLSDTPLPWPKTSVSEATTLRLGNNTAVKRGVEAFACKQS